MPRICIAGINPESHRHVRPTTPPTDLITRVLLREELGPIVMGALVDIGPVTAAPSPPESEDHVFQTANVEYVRDLDDQEFLDLLDQVRDADIQTAFGPALENVRGGYAIEAGSGERSLAVVRAYEPPTLIVGGWGKLRLHVRDLDPAPNLSVADVRFYEADQKTIRSDVVRDVNARIKDGVDVLLMLGLPHAMHRCRGTIANATGCS
ncbi:MAG TPA: hypothetical protein VIJ39_08290 [Solirubrobacteraceae bacterium]